MPLQLETPWRQVSERSRASGDVVQTVTVNAQEVMVVGEARQLVAVWLTQNLDDDKIPAFNHRLEIPVDRGEVDTTDVRTRAALDFTWTQRPAGLLEC